MTESEKAKAYDEALEKAKDCLKDGTITSTAIDYIETIFPELAESEDEKTRKWLINWLQNTEGQVLPIDKYNAALAWLEKQGKQDARYKYLEELLAADDIYQMSVNDTMTNEAKEKAAKALSKLCIGKLLGFEKQGEQKTTNKSATTKQEGWIEIPFGAKDSELQEETYYIPKGFHAEIDNDKVVIKKGEKSAAWSDEDEENLQHCCMAISADGLHTYEDKQEMEAWLKSLKERIGG